MAVEAMAVVGREAAAMVAAMAAVVKEEVMVAGKAVGGMVEVLEVETARASRWLWCHHPPTRRKVARAHRHCRSCLLVAYGASLAGARLCAGHAPNSLKHVASAGHHMVL